VDQGGWVPLVYVYPASDLPSLPCSLTSHVWPPQPW